MRSFIIAAALLVSTGPAAAAPANLIGCQAKRDLFCDLEGCKSTASDLIYVNLSYDIAKNEGDLCTFTYCRTFTLLLLPGSSESRKDGLLGAVRSHAAGSTEELKDKPALDYLLWIAPDQKKFVLFGQGEDASSGWAGACLPNAVD